MCQRFRSLIGRPDAYLVDVNVNYNMPLGRSGLEKHNASDPAVITENRIYLALGDLYHLETAAAIDIAGRISLQMTAIVGDAIMQNDATAHRLAALQYIEDAVTDLAALRAQVRGPSPADS